MSKYKLNKKARTELERRGITPEKGIFYYQNALGLGYINGKKLSTALAETHSKTGGKK